MDIFKNVNLNTPPSVAPTIISSSEGIVFSSESTEEIMASVESLRDDMPVPNQNNRKPPVYYIREMNVDGTANWFIHVTTMYVNRYELGNILQCIKDTDHVTFYVPVTLDTSTVIFINNALSQCKNNKIVAPYVIDFDTIYLLSKASKIEEYKHCVYVLTQPFAFAAGTSKDFAVAAVTSAYDIDRKYESIVASGLFTQEEVDLAKSTQGVISCANDKLLERIKAFNQL